MVDKVFILLVSTHVDMPFMILGVFASEELAEIKVQSVQQHYSYFEYEIKEYEVSGEPI